MVYVSAEMSRDGIIWLVFVLFSTLGERQTISVYSLHGSRGLLQSVQKKEKRTRPTQFLPTCGTATFSLGIHPRTQNGIFSSSFRDDGGVTCWSICASPGGGGGGGVLLSTLVSARVGSVENCSWSSARLLRWRRWLRKKNQIHGELDWSQMAATEWTGLIARRIAYFNYLFIIKDMVKQTMDYRIIILNLNLNRLTNLTTVSVQTFKCIENFKKSPNNFLKVMFL